MPNDPTISVITPSFNQGQFIRATIESALGQGGGGWEHVVVDGGSTDDTVSILESYSHVIWVSEKDRGQSDALNKGLAKSSGDIIFWINSDDIVADGAFDAAREFFSARPDASIVCGNAVVIDGDGREIRRMGPRVRAEQLRRPWNGSTSMHQPSIVFRRKVWEQIGPFDVNLHLAMDYDFFLRASAVFTLHQHPVDFGLFREYAGTKTGEGTVESFKEVRRCLERFEKGIDGGSPRRAAILGYFAEGCAWANDAVACYRSGNHVEARRLMIRALVRNPLSIFVLPHLHYRSRQLLGRTAHDFLRRRLARTR